MNTVTCMDCGWQSNQRFPTDYFWIGFHKYRQVYIVYLHACIPCEIIKEWKKRTGDPVLFTERQAHSKIVRA